MRETTFYVAGSADDEIKEYTLSSAFDFSSTITFIEANPFPSREINPQGMSFNNDGTKLFVAGDQQNMVSELALSVPYDISTGDLNFGTFLSTRKNRIFVELRFNNTGNDHVHHWV